MLSEQAALLRAICDNPEEDTPRLVYADWLQETGADSNIARAEFIRLQIAKAAESPDRSIGSMSPEEVRLFIKCKDEWFSELPQFPGLKIVHAYNRGFHFRLHAKSVSSFLQAAPELFSRIPIIEVCFYSVTPHTALQLASSPFLALVRHLKQSDGGWDDNILIHLTATPHLRNLEDLTLGDKNVTILGVRSFLTNRSLKKMRHVALWGCNRVGPELVQAILDCPSSAVLETIELPFCQMGPEVASDLPALLQLPRLQRLSLNNNVMGDDAAFSLAGATANEGFELFLEGNLFTDRGGEAFLNGKLLHSPGIKMNLRSNAITKEMAVRLKEAFGKRVSI